MLRRILPLSLTRNRDLQWTLAVFAVVSMFILTTLTQSTFPWFVYIPTMFVASIIIAWRPRVGVFAIILLTMMWERFFTLNVVVIAGHVVKLYPLDILLGVTFIAAVAHWLIARRAPFLHTFGRFEKWLLVFGILATVYFFESQLAAIREPDIAFSTFKNYAFYPLLTFSILALIRTRAHFTTLIQTMLIGGVGILLFLGLGVMNGVGLWTEHTPLSTEGVRYLAFPHAFYLMITALIGAAAWSHKRIRHPRVFTIVLALSVIGIISSLMRHLWIALLFGLGLLVLMAPRRVRMQFLRFAQIPMFLALLTALGFVVVALFFPETALGIGAARYLDPLVARLASFTDITADLSALWRLELWKTAFGAWLLHPFVGVGYGREITFTVLDFTSTVRLRDLHNSLFGMLVQMGVVGVATFTILLASLARWYAKARRGARFRPWTDGAVAAIGAFLVASLFQPYFETNILGIMFWVLLGIVRVGPLVSRQRPIDHRHFRRLRSLKIVESTPRNNQ